MNDMSWKIFFNICAENLGEGESNIEQSNSWCSWTTFSRLTWDSGYWQAGLPKAVDIGESYIKDGGVWGQPFHYSDIAHVIIPKTFTTEKGLSKTQQIEVVGDKLEKRGINCRLTNLVLELKLY